MRKATRPPLDQKTLFCTFNNLEYRKPMGVSRKLIAVTMKATTIIIFFFLILTNFSCSIDKWDINGYKSKFQANKMGLTH